MRPVDSLRVIGILTFLAGPAAAQSDEPVMDQLLAKIKTPYLNVGMLLQAVGDFQIDRTFALNNGFSIPNFRLLASGELDIGFGYMLATNFVRNRAILDAAMSYRFNPSVRAQVGQFKIPFSYEFLTYAGSIDFVDRAQAVTLLAPGRDMGAQVRVGSQEARLHVTGGVFNGNGTNVLGNDNDSFLGAVRVDGVVPTGSGDDAGRVLWGVNGAYSRDDSLSIAGEAQFDFAGKRALVGLDVRAELGQWLLATEWIVSSFNPDAGAVRNPWGFHATAGYLIQPKVQLLGRIDAFDSDGTFGRRDLLIGGLNAWPTRATEIQVNYTIDVGEAQISHHRFLVNFQIGF